MNPLTNSFFAGLFFLLSGGSGLVRHFLLEPNVPNYPRAPQWLLNVFFVFASVLIFMGLRYLAVWANGQGATVPPGATGMGVLLAFTLMVYKLSLLANVLQQRYPANVWQRLNRINTLVRCSRKS